MSKIKLGLHPLTLGLVIDKRLIAPPSQFALATIGTKSKKEIRIDLERLIQAHQSGSLDVSDTPMLTYHLERELLDVQTLAQMVQRVEHSQKMIIKSSNLPINQKGHALTISPKPQVSAKVDSRRLRTKQKPYSVQAYNVFDLLKLRFEGGTRLTEVTSARGQHWNYNLKHEKLHLDNFDDQARDRFEQPFSIIDYTRAALLITLDRLIKEDKTHRIKFDGDFQLQKVNLPFDFSESEKGFDRMKYAWETFLLRYSTPKIIRETIGHTTGILNLAEIDQSLLGKKIIADPVVKEALASEEITKGALLHNKSFRGYHWGIIQAFENYFHTQKRDFNLYSLEFVGTPHQTMSIVYDLPKEKSRSGQDVSLRIVFDENFKPPIAIYKVKNPKENAKPLGHRKPTSMVNWPVDRQDPRYIKKWTEIDWHSGKPVLCTAWEPTGDILLDAAKNIRRVNRRRISPYQLRGWYLQAAKDRKQSL